MVNLLIFIAVAIIAAGIAVGITLMVQKNMASTRATQIVAEAERLAEDLKLKKSLKDEKKLFASHLKPNVRLSRKYRSFSLPKLK